MGFFDKFPWSNAKPEPTSAVNKPTVSEIPEDLTKKGNKKINKGIGSASQSWDSINKKEKNLKNNKKLDDTARQNIIEKLDEQKKAFKEKFGVDYNPNFEIVKKSLRSGQKPQSESESIESEPRDENIEAEKAASDLSPIPAEISSAEISSVPEVSAAGSAQPDSVSNHPNQDQPIANPAPDQPEPGLDLTQDSESPDNSKSDKVKKVKLSRHEKKKGKRDLKNKPESASVNISQGGESVKPVKQAESIEPAETAEPAVVDNPVPAEPVEENIEPAPNIDYRTGFKELKLKKGKFTEEQKRYSEFREVYKDLGGELEALSGELVSEKVSADLDKNLQAIADKAGLDLALVKEIYQNHQHMIVDEVKKELRQGVSKTKTIGKAIGKSAAYIGLGLGAATLGLGGLVAAGALAAVRVIDRVSASWQDKKKLDDATKKKKAELNSDQGREKLKASLAAAISLQNKIAIDRVDLGSKKDRAKLIDAYLEEQYRDGDLKEQLEGHDLNKYKDQMVRVIEGLDEINRLNLRQEEKLKKTGLSGIMQKAEGLISGGKEYEKNVSTAVLIGMSIAAHEIPGVRQVMSGLIGYRVGGALGDSMAKRLNARAKFGVELLKYNMSVGEEIKDLKEYHLARQALLDQDLKTNNPLQYQQILMALEKAESRFLASGQKDFSVEKLNDFKKPKSWRDKMIKAGSRLFGAAAGVFLGREAENLLRSGQEAAASGLSNTEVDATAPGQSDAQLNPEGVTPTPDASEAPDADAEADLESKIVPDSSFAEKTVPEAKIEGDSETEVSPGAETDPKASVVPEVNPETDPGNKILFKDEISNADLKPGRSDSVWRSTAQIFKDNAETLGYKGDLNDAQALNSWVNMQTAEALNNSGNITDKVFEGNQVILEQNEAGDYQVRVDQASGLKPSYLEKAVPSVNEVEDPAPNQDLGPDNNPIVADEQVLTHDQGQAAEILGHEPGFGGYDKDPEEELDYNPRADGYEGEAGEAPEIKEETQELKNDQIDGRTEEPKIESNQDAPEFLDGRENNWFEKTLAQNAGAELVDSQQALDSIDSLQDLPNGSKLQVGELILSKHDNVYEFTYPDGKSTNLLIQNNPATTDKFIVLKDGLQQNTYSDQAWLQETISHKQAIYDNLPDKQSNLGRMLKLDLIRNTEELKHIEDFNQPVDFDTLK